MRKWLLVLVSIVLNNILWSQKDQSLTRMLIEKDSLFWLGYNTCNMEMMQAYLADAVEFYHDKGGILLGVDQVMNATKKNICGNPDNKIRREGVDGSFKVFPMYNGDKIYGAVLSGEHYFYNKPKDKQETKEGLAKFTHLWLLKDQQWKMHRILSFDHGPSPYISQRKVNKQAESILEQWTGTYEGPQAGMGTVKKMDDHLVLMLGQKSYDIYPASESIYFSLERDLTFEFIKNEQGKVSKIAVKEKGNLVEQLVFKNK